MQEQKKLIIWPSQATVDIEFEIPPATLERLTRQELTYSLSGLLLGLLCVIAGVVLFLLGVTGTVGWSAKMLGAESELACEERILVRTEC